MAAAYKTILECYVKSNYIKNIDISEIQYRNPHRFLALEDMYFGGEVTEQKK